MATRRRRRMKKPYLGVWLDHAQAYLIWMDEQGQAEVQHVQAEPLGGGEKANQVVPGGIGVYGAVAPHATLADKRQQQARRLYDRVIRAMLSADKVYVFGPGLARKELKKRLEQHKDFAGQLVAIQSADKMSEAQMAAQVRTFFDLPRSAP